MGPTGSAFVARNIDPAADNKIHDDDVARSLGFTGALVPGVELFARACTPLVDAHGAAFLTGGRVALRFRRPVYDGEQVEVGTAGPAEAGERLVLNGPDGTERAVGAWSVGARSVGHAPGIAALATAGLPDPLPPAVPASLPPGPLGTVHDAVDRERARLYVAAIEDPLPLWDDVVHPGLLLRFVNLLLMRNVDLGPWIHTGSDAVLLAPAPLPARIEVRGAVTGLSTTRTGHDVVRYDAVVLADDVPVLLVDHTAVFRLAG